MVRDRMARWNLRARPVMLGQVEVGPCEVWVRDTSGAVPVACYPRPTKAQLGRRADVGCREERREGDCEGLRLSELRDRGAVSGGYPRDGKNYAEYII